MYANDIDTAKLGAILKTIPNESFDIAVTSTSASGDELAAVAGRWVWLEAIGANITYKRGVHTLTAGSALVLADGDIVDYFISGSGDKTLSRIVASGTATLRVHYDTEAG